LSPLHSSQSQKCICEFWIYLSMKSQNFLFHKKSMLSENGYKVEVISCSIIYTSPLWHLQKQLLLYWLAVVVQVQNPALIKYHLGSLRKWDKVLPWLACDFFVLDCFSIYGS
jgi:hypothetical protein